MERVRRFVACTLVALAAGCSEAEQTVVQPVAVTGPPALSAGDERDFPPGKLAEGDVIRCVAGGLVAKIAVPKPRRRSFVTTTHAWKKDGAQATIRLDVRPTGRIVASCS